MSRREQLIAAVAVVVVAARAVAAAPGQPALEPTLSAAIAAYEAMEFDAARAALEQVAADSARPAPERAMAQLYLGLTRFTLGARAEARAAFVAALALDPAVRPPAATSPKIVEAFAEVRAEVGTTAPPAPPSARTPLDRRWLWLGGLGLVTLGASATALGFGLDARAERRAFAEEPWANLAAPHRDAAERSGRIAGVALGVGGAALAAAVALGWLDGLPWQHGPALVPAADGVSLVWPVD